MVAIDSNKFHTKMAENIRKTCTYQIDKGLTYFKQQSANVNIKIFECTLCRKSINGTKRSNLLAHLKSVHRDIYESKINIQNPENDVKVERLKCMQHLVELVTVNKMPFNLLLKYGFQNLIAEKLNTFDEAGIGINLNYSNLQEIKRHLGESAMKIRNAIISEVQNKLVSLSVDIVSKNNRSILGIHG